MNSNKEIEIASARSWCWTKPVINDPSFILNENNGGINWGFCTSSKETSNKKKLYYVSILTSSLPGSGSSSKIFITIYSRNGESSEMILSERGFETGSFIRKKIFGEDVGNINKIRLSNHGDKKYTCNTIKIDSGMNSWNFECNRPLDKQSFIDLYVINMINYEITVKTSALDHSGTIEPIYIKLLGIKNKSPEKLLSNTGFVTGSLVQIHIETINVGSVLGIMLFIKGNDEWRPEEIIVKKSAENVGFEEKVFKVPGNAILDSPARPLTLELNLPESNNSDDVGSRGLLDSKDQENIIKLACTDVMKDKDIFGPNYVTSNVNYMNFLAECPSDCLRAQTRAIGIGVHPEESPICINALVDRAVSLYGGYINISIYRGFPSYTGGNKIFGIPVLAFGASKRSYTIAKVDNIDMIARDVRILDSDGKPSFKGRLELRNEGKWGTICANNLVNTAAIIICKEIGYKEGKFLNPSPEKGRKFCANYEGMNYCGAQPSDILFSNLQCQGNEESIMQCYRIMADKTFCNHDYDTLIECTNKSEDEVGNFQSGTLRIIDVSENPSPTGIGRLEILKGNWGTVCSTKFINTSARIACKQMGYLDGRMFGEQDSVDMCSNVLGNNLCGDYKLPINLTEVRCTGYENSFRDCAFKKTTNSCSHFNDVVVKCEGYGDPSGRSQNIRPSKVLSPLIEKMPMAPIYNAKCSSSANDIHFRGDPGSIYLVSCPSGCTGDSQLVTGSGIYTFNSSMCKAAIQSGVISDQGGIILVVKSYGQNKYFGSILRGISSQDSNYMKMSFYVTRTNTAYFNMVSMINNGSSFIELDQKSILQSQTLPAIYNFKSRIFSSFIEIDNNSDTPSCNFEWISPHNEFLFNGKNVFKDISLVDGSNTILYFKSFTIYVKLRMLGFNSKKQVILSLGGCNGYSLVIDDNSEIVFDLNCGKSLFKSGIYVPLKSFVFLSIVYNGSNIIFYSNGKLMSQISTYFTINPEKKITIGRHSNFSKWFFFGKIDYIAFYSEALSSIMNQDIFINGYKRPLVKKLSKFITLDFRSCISSCAVQPFPGTPGSPQAPPEALSYKINGENQMMNGNNEKESVETKLNNDVSALKEIGCKDNGSHLFKGLKKGDKRRIKCRDNCSTVDLNIFGTIVYTLDSPICKAAIHSGILKEQGGKIIIKLVSGLKYYMGSMQYGIQSVGISKSTLAYIIENAPPVSIISCKETASNIIFSGPIGMKFLVKCPVDCSKISHNVFGSNIYSGDSSICQSAIHFGALNDRGGEVNFVIEKGEKLYYGKRSFGIESKDRDIYVKSIKFFAGKNTLFIKYQEQFTESDLSKNWNIVDTLDSSNYPSKWQYVKSTLNPKKNMIEHSSKIKSNLLYQYGSMILLKKADIVNAIFKINMFFINMNPVGIIFRYKDQNNFYHLRLNNNGPFKILLIKNYEGKSTILASSTISISPRLWYSFTILMYYDSFSINLQIGDLRNIMTIISQKDNDLQRGGLGIATNGNNEFYISSIFIDDYKLKKSFDESFWDKRTFDTILKENTNMHRAKFCKSKFKDDMLKVLSCKEFHNYCKNKCNDLIHERENILNYNCYKRCVKDSILKLKIDNMQLTDDVVKSINSSLWMPIEKEKCDFRPDDLSFNFAWTPCIIEEIDLNTNDPEQKIIKIKYKQNNDEMAVSLLYPSNVLKKCGEIISSRTDCK